MTEPAKPAPRATRKPRVRKPPVPSPAPSCSGQHALADLGEVVDLSSSRTFVLDSPQSVWVVDEGLIDVFAAAPVNGAEASSDGGAPDDGELRFGRWHFMCRVSAGTILLGSPPGPRHVLVAKPLPGGRARKIPLADLRHAQAAHWTDEPSAERLPSVVTGQARLLAEGLDAGIEATHNGVRTALPPRAFTPLEPGPGLELPDAAVARSISGVLWVRVLSGRIRLGGPAIDRTYQFGDQLAIGESYWLESGDGPAVLYPRTTAD